MICDPPFLSSAFPNLREVRDLPAEDGRRLRGGRLFRSEALIAPDIAAVDILRALRIARVVDLRSAGERAAAPNDWWRSEGVAIDEIDLAADARVMGDHWRYLLDDPDGDGGAALMRATYRMLPAAALPHVGGILDRLEQDAGAIMIHCTAGKDRTGVVVALILHALGIERQAIRADYMETARRENPAVVAATRALLARQMGREPKDHVLRALSSADLAYLDESVAVIERDFGGTSAYLERAGWPDARLRGLRDRLLA